MPKLAQQSEWTFELIDQYHCEIAKIAEKYRLKTYPNQLEIITSEQMMDAYSSVGMPVTYRHWSYGKEFIATEKRYKKGYMGLAYEIVINSDPCISYLMEENTLAMQALVIAHAAYGHNSFFKNNYLFKMWTDASSIIDYLVFARDYVQKCEEKYGVSEVESVLDACHSLMNLGVDRYKRPSKISLSKEQALMEERQEHARLQVNDLWRTLPIKKESEASPQESARYPAEPQENILYFIEKNSPFLEGWKRELVRIVRKISQYFYPQKQTQVMNEGWATFWHYTILNEMYDTGLVGEGMVLEWLASHTAVVYQPEVSSKYYSGINPYALGFAMFQDIKRICIEPTEEDRHWFEFAGCGDWLGQLHYAMENFKDESFISQYLSPKVMRDFKFFSILDEPQEEFYKVSAIHNERGYRKLREKLSNQYNLGEREPNIQVWNVEFKGDRSLHLRYFQKNNKPLQMASSLEVLKHIKVLWGFDVQLEKVDEKGEVSFLAKV